MERQVLWDSLHRERDSPHRAATKCRTCQYEICPGRRQTSQCLCLPSVFKKDQQTDKISPALHQASEADQSLQTAPETETESPEAEAEAVEVAGQAEAGRQPAN